MQRYILFLFLLFQLAGLGLQLCLLESNGTVLISSFIPPKEKRELETRFIIFFTQLASALDQ